MRSFLLALCLCAAACSPSEPKHAFTLQGQILSIDVPRKTLIIKHGDIKGLMPAMTMPYTVRDPTLLSGIAAGDLVDATLVVGSNDAYLSTITKTGRAPLEAPSAEAPTPTAAPGVELLKDGDAVPDAPFVDQNAKRLRFSQFNGVPVVMTFIYTRCPLPDFCPLMDRHFAAIQKTLESDPTLAAVRLVTVSFDPANDSPAVLKQHGKELGANFARWTFLTGDRDDIDGFASRFGVVVSRAPNDPRDVTHNLRTVIVDAHGRLAKTYTGNEWTPEQLVTDLRDVVRDSGVGNRKIS
jgi:protein SCO1